MSRTSQEPPGDPGPQDGAATAAARSLHGSEAELEPFSQAVLLSVRSKSNPLRGMQLTLPREGWVPPADLKAAAPEGLVAPVVLPTEVERVIAIEVATDPASMPPALARQASLNRRSPESRPPSRLRRLTSALDASDADSSPGLSPRQRTQSPPPGSNAKEAPILKPPPVIELLARSQSTPDVSVLAFESRTERLLNQHRRLEEQHGTSVTLPVLVPGVLESGGASPRLRNRTPSRPSLHPIPSAKIMDLNLKARLASAPAPPIQESAAPKPQGFLRRALACLLPLASDKERKSEAAAAEAAAQEAVMAARGLQLSEAGKGLSAAELLRKSISLLSASGTPRSTAGLSDDLLAADMAAPADVTQLHAVASAQPGGSEPVAPEALEESQQPNAGQDCGVDAQQQAAQPSSEASGAAKKGAPHKQERRYGDSPKRSGIGAAGSKPAAKQPGATAAARAAGAVEEGTHGKAKAAGASPAKLGGDGGDGGAACLQPRVRFGQESAAEQHSGAAEGAPAAGEAALLQELEALTAQARAKHQAALAVVQEYEREHAATPGRDRWWALAEAALDSPTKEPWRLSYFDRPGPGMARRPAQPQPKSPRQLARERKMLANRKPLYQPPRRLEELKAASPKAAPAAAAVTASGSPKHKGGRRQEAAKHASLFSVPTELAKVQGSESGERSPSTDVSDSSSSQQQGSAAESSAGEQAADGTAPPTAGLHEQAPAEEPSGEPAPGSSQESFVPSKAAAGKAAAYASLPAKAAPVSTQTTEQPAAKPGAARKLSGFWAGGGSGAKRPSIWRTGALFRTLPAVSSGAGEERIPAAPEAAGAGQFSATFPRAVMGNGV